jgi:hypothetical protein
MIWKCHWCGHPRIVPAINPVTYICDECGREAGGVFDPALPVPDLREEERELVDVRVTWSGVVPDNGTLRALRSLDPKLRDESLAAVVDALRQKGYYSLGIHSRSAAGRVADDARVLGLHVVVETAG